MITNTQRILYKDGYFPAYLKKVDSKTRFQGYNYDIQTIQEVKTDRVWKVELQNGLVTYFSDCVVFTDLHWPKHISTIQTGDNILTYSPGFESNGPKSLAKQLANAFVLNDETCKKGILKKYKIKSLSKFKLLANNIDLIGEFLCEIVKFHLKDLRYESIIIKNIFSYEFLQEILLACSLFGIHASITKESGKWVLLINRDSFIKFTTQNGGYLVKTIPVANIYEIKQDTQAFQISIKTINQLVVNSIIVQGD